MAFAQLRIITHYSGFGSIIRIPELFERASELGLKGLAITDFNEMGGVPEFLSVAKKYPDIKPVIGCELDVTFNEQVPSHITLLAKNKIGYHNLVKLSSIACTANSSPRLTPSIIEAHRDGLICLAPMFAMEGDAANWFLDAFGEDFYLILYNELFAEDAIALSEIGIKTVLADDICFVHKEEALAFETFQSYHIGATIKEDCDPDKLPDCYLKSEEEVRALYPEYPEFIDNTIEVLDKIERYSINADLGIPFLSEHSQEELRKLTYEGAKSRYGEITDDLRKRIDFELDTIASRYDFSSYFLIIKEMIDWVRQNNGIAGPGRGSAVGCVVNYCLGITDIDPLKYGLLFERFLNPDRIQLPDIDTDFDDKGLDLATRHLAEKYGGDKMSYVRCYYPLRTHEAFAMAATTYGAPSEEIDKIMEFLNWRSLESELDNNRRLQRVYQTCSKRLQDAYQTAIKLEGVYYRVGMHACANIISSEPLTERLPISLTAKKGWSKEEDEIVPVSQYDVHWVEDAGVLKIDTLGLLTLDIINETSALVKKKYGIDININEIPLKDETTLKIYQTCDTEEIFQFDTEGIRMWLDKLQPDSFAQLVAFNAMYRPGPMDFIPDYVFRKNGQEPISYIIPETEDILSETFGLFIYQEQVMMIAQKIAGFTPGQSDKLRKIVGSRTNAAALELSDTYHDLFIKGGLTNGHDYIQLEELWQKLERVGPYVFNKSHAVAYTWLSYQTAWLKAHYREEYLECVAKVEKRFGR